MKKKRKNCSTTDGSLKKKFKRLDVLARSLIEDVKHIESVSGTLFEVENVF